MGLVLWWAVWLEIWQHHPYTQRSYTWTRVLLSPILAAILNDITVQINCANNTLISQSPHPVNFTEYPLHGCWHHLDISPVWILKDKHPIIWLPTPSPYNALCHPQDLWNHTSHTVGISGQVLATQWWKDILKHSLPLFLCLSITTTSKTQTLYNPHCLFLLLLESTTG